MMEKSIMSNYSMGYLSHEEIEADRKVFSRKEQLLNDLLH